MKFKPFHELTNIMLCEQCKTSGETSDEGAVYSPNLGFPKSIPKAINSPCPQVTKVETVAMSLQ